MAQYEVKIAITLYLIGKVTVEAPEKDGAYRNVQEMIEQGAFQITDWKVETSTEHRDVLDEVQESDQMVEIESIEEVVP